MPPELVPARQFRIKLDKGSGVRMTCQQAQCDQFRAGWMTVLDPADATHAAHARWLVNATGRRFLRFTAADAIAELERVGPAEGITVTPAMRTAIERLPGTFLVFVFFPGQQCFREHRIDRDVTFAKRSGLMDGRGRFTPNGITRLHSRPQDFNEDMNESADRVARLAGRG